MNAPCSTALFNLQCRLPGQRGVADPINRVGAMRTLSQLCDTMRTLF
jgi:hypothetical protein